MSVFAGRAVFPQAFTDGFGNGRGGLSIAIYERITYTDGVTTSGSTRLTSATAAFTSDDEDKSITAQNFPSGATIQTYVSPTEVDLSLPATASGTGRSFVIAGRQRSADLATVYSDRLKAVTASNPYIADAAGNAFPYLDPGDYDAVSIHGVTPFSVLADHSEPLATAVVEEAMLAFNVATQAELDAGLATKAAATTAKGGGVARVNEGPLSVLDPRIDADNTGATDAGPNLNAAKAMSDDVFMPPGMYKIETVVDYSNVHPTWDPYTGTTKRLKGAGHQATILTGGESGFGFIECVGSNRLTFEGFSIQGAGSKQYGILGGRTTGDASAGGHVFRDVYVYGSFTLGGIFMLSSESCAYEKCVVYTTAGPAMVLARDLRGWTATAKHTALSASNPISGGNGVIRMDRCLLVTIRTPDDGGTWDSPLVLEYVQTFDSDSLYMLSSGAPLVLIDKGCHQAKFDGLHQEWNSSIPGATEPYGIYVKDTTTGSEPKVVRMQFDASSLYPIFGEDNQRFSGLSVRGSGFRTNTRTFEVDVWAADKADLPVSFTAVGGHEDATPTYRARTGATRITGDAHRTVFTGAQTDTLYNIPPGAKVLTVSCQGQGGSGGSGARRAAGVLACGGGSGGSGGYSEVEINVSELNGSTLRVTINTQGAGAPAVTTDDTNGSAGGNGGYAQVATSAGGGGLLCRASGGSGGGGGTNAAGGSAGTGGLGRFTGQTGQAASSTGTAGVAPSSVPLGAPGAGGSGGGITTGDVASAGGGGGPSVTFTPTGAAGGAVGANGATGNTPAANVVAQGGGGGGGGSSATATAGAGGNGMYGGGGGGGGASRNGFASGAGGTGGAAFVSITARF